MDRVIIALEADRLTVASILVKNKYTVRQGSEKRAGTNSYDYYLEYERNPDADKPRKAAKKEDAADGS